MTTTPMHADVWVIEQGHAILFRQQDQQWAEEQRLPYSEFSGSAIALSSFSLPDTLVYLNVFQNKIATSPWAEHRWAGIAEDPPRIIESPATAFHQEVLTELRSMGQSVRIISSEKSAQFNRAVHMALLNTHEFKHLKNFLNSNKSGISQFRSSFQLYLGLWVKPSGHYQAVRGAAVACVLGTFLLMSWHTNQQQSKLEKANLQHLKNSLGAAPRNAKEAPFAGWLEQIRKFGQDERANLLSLKMSWDEQGEILTTADLARARKRVPKGCSLNNSTQAQCSVGATNQ
ncbi:hypothetical protein [Limnobacter sp.]|uniref:hypothetical protein n=1 Tax=Limnobacter sp. TaxID=2003368 RepID=UPI0027361970|nr:hypothetical protein [Limnobacter sp.]MDP3270895.1 hypothetical protein [Limnobacter sp.]